MAMSLDENPRLQRPDTVSFRLFDRLAQQRCPHSLPSRSICDVDADLCHTAINLPARHGAQRGPSQNFSTA